MADTSTDLSNMGFSPGSIQTLESIIGKRPNVAISPDASPPVPKSDLGSLGFSPQNQTILQGIIGHRPVSAPSETPPSKSEPGTVATPALNDFLASQGVGPFEPIKPGKLTWKSALIGEAGRTPEEEVHPLSIVDVLQASALGFKPGPGPAWDWSATWQDLKRFADMPIVPFRAIDSWLGGTAHRGGFLGAAEELAEGLLTPKMLLLQAALAPIAEVDAVPILGKALGIGADEAKTLTKGIEIWRKLRKEGEPAAEVLSKAGFNVEKVEAAIGVLKQAGVGPELGKQQLAVAGLSNVMRAFGAPTPWVNGLARAIPLASAAGFGIDQTITAWELFPQVSSAFSKQDYDTGFKLAGDALVSTGFAALSFLGARHAGREWADLAKGKLGFDLTVTDNVLKARKLYDVMSLERQTADNRGRLAKEALLKNFNDLSEDQRRATRWMVEAPDDNTLRFRYNRVREAAKREPDSEVSEPDMGRATHKISITPRDLDPTEIVDLKTGGLEDDRAGSAWATTIPNEDIVQHNLQLIKEGKPVDPIILSYDDQGNFLVNESRGLESAMAAKQVGLKAIPIREQRFINYDPAGARIEEYFVKASEGRLAASKNYSSKQIDQLLASMKLAINATPRMREFATRVKDILTEEVQNANKEGLQIGWVDNYLTNMWEPLEVGDPALPSQVFTGEMHGGGLQTQVTMALHRMFSTSTDGIINGYKLLDGVLDPANVIHNYIARTGRAIAGRHYVDSLANIYGSDGMPAVAAESSAHVVENEKGELAVLVPNTTRLIRIPDKVIKQLKATGRLESFIRQDKIIRVGDDHLAVPGYSPDKPNMVLEGPAKILHDDIISKGGLTRMQATSWMALIKAAAETHGRDFLKECERMKVRYGTQLPKAMADVPLFETDPKGVIKGAVTFASDGQATIWAFSNFDVSTAVHELGHIFRRSMMTPDELLHFERAFGVKDGVWKPENEEQAARSFEKYLATGDAPKPELTSLFARFKRWMLSIYRNITTHPDMKDALPEDARRGWNRFFGIQEAPAPEPGGAFTQEANFQNITHQVLGNGEPYKGVFLGPKQEGVTPAKYNDQVIIINPRNAEPITIPADEFNVDRLRNEVWRSSAKTAPREISKLFENSGRKGSTFNLNASRGDMSNSMQYAVSLFPEREAVHDIPDSPEKMQEVISDFIAKNQDLLKDPRLNVGLRHDTESGKLFLDVSLLTPDKDLALQAGHQYGQKGVTFLDGKDFPYLPTLPIGGEVTPEKIPETQRVNMLLKGDQPFYQVGKPIKLAPTEIEEAKRMGRDKLDATDWSYYERPSAPGKPNVLVMHGPFGKMAYNAVLGSDLYDGSLAWAGQSLSNDQARYLSRLFNEWASAAEKTTEPLFWEKGISDKDRARALRETGNNFLKAADYNSPAGVALVSDYGLSPEQIRTTIVHEGDIHGGQRAVAPEGFLFKWFTPDVLKEIHSSPIAEKMNRGLQKLGYDNPASWAAEHEAFILTGEYGKFLSEDEAVDLIHQHYQALLKQHGVKAFENPAAEARTYINNLKRMEYQYAQQRSVGPGGPQLEPAREELSGLPGVREEYPEALRGRAEAGIENVPTTPKPTLREKPLETHPYYQMTHDPTPISTSGWVRNDGKFEEAPYGHIEWLLKNGYKTYKEALDKDLIRVSQPESGNTASAIAIQLGKINSNNINRVEDILSRLKVHPKSLILMGWNEDQEGYGHLAYKNINDALESFRQDAVRKLNDPTANQTYYQDDKVQGMTKEETPQAEHYLWNTKTYRTVPHSAFRKWVFGAKAPDSTPVYMNADLRVHPEFYDAVTRTLGLEKSVFQQSRPLATLIKGSTEAKHIMLSFSPFHLAQEGLRAAMTGINPFGPMRFDITNDPILREGVLHGLTLEPDYQGMSGFEEGLAGGSKLVAKIPVLGRIQTWLQDFLFRKYIPGLKARAYARLADSYKKAYPDWGTNRVSEAAAADCNERFGGINWKRMGRAAGTQDFLRLATLAPDWLESELRFTVRSLGAQGRVARRDLMFLTAGLWGASRAINMLVSGNPHLEAPFGVAIKDKEGKETIYSVRTLPTDILHLLQDPIGFMKGRASPLVRAGGEAFYQRDWAGRKLTPVQTALDMTRGIMPIGTQAALKKATGELPPEVSTASQVGKALGLTAAPFRTAAETMATKLASEKNEDGPIDPAKLGGYQLQVEVEDKLRAKEISPDDLMHMVEQGQMPPGDAKKIFQVVRKTAGLDAPAARLYIKASRLPLPDFIKVWEVATNDEKAMMTPLLLRKRNLYLKNMHKSMTPAQWSKDETYLWILKTFPGARPWGMEEE